MGRFLYVTICFNYYYQTVQSCNKNIKSIVAHTFIPALARQRQTEFKSSLSSRPTWSTEQVPQQLGLHRETLSQHMHTPQTYKLATTNRTLKYYKLGLLSLV